MSIFEKYYRGLAPEGIHAVCHLRSKGHTIDSLKVNLMEASSFYERRMRKFDLEFPVPHSLVLDLSVCCAVKTFELRPMPQDYEQYTRYIADIISAIPRSTSSTTSTTNGCLLVRHIDFINLQMKKVIEVSGVCFMDSHSGRLVDLSHLWNRSKMQKS
ncbi:hypothetical protein C8Q75DRAFT_895801 [Abortiporus biennis]|nr:hypothetical protein C8Q75DRAFT_895801 [Abortiporus biennis]